MPSSVFVFPALIAAWLLAVVNVVCLDAPAWVAIVPAVATLFVIIRVIAHIINSKK